MSKLEESKVQWIVRQRRNGVPAAQVAEAMKVTTRWVGSLVARYKGCEIGDIVLPRPMGRPGAGCGAPGGVDGGVGVLCSRGGATLLAESIEHDTGLRIPPHRVVYAQLVANRLAVNDPRKSGQRRMPHYVKRFSNTMWHTDYKMLHDNRWVLSYMDDASRVVPGHGVFERATPERAQYACPILRRRSYCALTFKYSANIGFRHLKPLGTSHPDFATRSSPAVMAGSRPRPGSVQRRAPCRLDMGAGTS